MADAFERLGAALADRYRIERELGSGGMATVYLAADLKHDRQVAIKVLRPELAAVLGAERFVQEIKTTAALNHPHILPLFDSGTADGFLYYVMPYIQGETIRERLNRETQFGIEEALKIATEVADALQYAHEQGVIHRDIKPENVLLHNGRPMVMDFGIALAVSAAAGGRMTETGLSLGTPHYMSPEQATADKQITARSDVYSLASVLYEMLTGSPPHLGGSAQQIIMKIVTETPAPVTQMRKSVPPNVAAAVAKALEKLPADRFDSAKAFAEALVRSGMMDTTEHRMATRGVSMPEPRRSLVASAGWGVAAAVALVAGWLALRPVAELPVSRFSIVLPAGQRLSGERGTRIALSPDGSALAYIGTDESGSRIWVRRRDQLSATPLPGTETAVTLFFAPDGRRIGYTDAGQRVHTVSLSGGPPSTVADTAVGLDGASWSADGYIYFDGFTGGGTNGLRRVPEAGGDAVVVTTVDTAGGEADHVWPTALPEGRGVLFVIARDGGLNSSDIAVLPPAGAYRVLVRGVAAAYASSGHLLYVTSDGSLMAAPFDLRRLEVTGEANAIGTSVGVRAFGATDLAVSGEGTVAYVTGGQASDPDEVVWVSLDGEIEIIDPDWSGSFQTLALSPDGRRLAISVQGNGEEQLWMKELPRGPITKLSFEGTLNYRPAWMPGGGSVSYISNQAGRSQLLRVRAEGGTTPEVVLDLRQQAGDVQEGLWRGDGTLIYRGTPRDIYALTPTGDTVPLVVTPFEERAPALSPTGRWLAYQSDESGRYEVYVRPFPDAAAGRWQVSTDGGVVPRWSPDGRALYYIGPQDMMTVDVLPGAGFTMGRRRALFSRSFLSGAFESSYDIAPDGRFVMIRSRAGGEGGDLVIIENIGRALRPATP